MTTPAMTLLMTRPRPASKRFVAQMPETMRARFDVCISPLIRIEPCVMAIPTGAARALIFTSANAVTIAAGLIASRDLPAYCVGPATTAAALRAGWQATNAGATAEALVRLMLSDQPTGPVLHLHGLHTRGSVVERLNKAGLRAASQVIYHQVTQSLSHEAVARLNGITPVIAPLFSPLTARQFADQALGGAPLWLAALSNAVAKPLKTLNSNKLVISKQPNSTAMYTAIEILVNTVGRVESSPNAQ